MGFIILPIIGFLTTQGALYAIAALAIAGTAIYLANRNKGGPKEPSLDAQRTSVQEPNMPVQKVYGTAWVGGKIIHSDNTRETWGSSTRPTGYMLMMALCRGDVTLLDAKVDSEGFFTNGELQDIRSGLAFIGRSVSGGENEFPITPDNPDGEITEVRKDKNDIASDASLSYIMTVFTKLNNTDESTVERLAQTIQDDLPNTRLTNMFSPPEGFVDWPQTQMRHKDTAMFFVHLPLRRDADKEQLWFVRPRFLFQLRTEKAALKLWDSIPNSPPVKEEWTNDNAALCLYDYLSEYTGFGSPVFNYSRIDLDSVASAADYCHENNLTCNGSITLTDSPAQVLAHFEDAMGGGTISSWNGIARADPGRRTPSLHRYTLDDINEDSWEIVHSPDRAVRKSVIDVAYSDIDGQRKNVAFEHELGDISRQVQQQELIFVNNNRQARQVAFIENARAWETRVLKFTLLPHAPLPGPNQTVTLNFPELGVHELEARVREIKQNTNNDTADISVWVERADLYTIPPQGNYIPAPVAPVGSGGTVGSSLIVGETGGVEDFLLVDATNTLRID